MLFRVFIIIILLCSSELLFVQGPQQMFWALNKCPFLLRQISTNPFSAYSLRKLNCTYTGFAIRVRNSSSGATQDIGFNSNLYTVSLKSFFGSNNGTIVRWYDQSGNSRTASQGVLVSHQMTGKMNGISIFPTGVIENNLNSTETNQKVYYGLF